MMISYPDIMKMNISLPSPASQSVLVPVQGCNTTSVSSHSSDYLGVGHIPKLDVADTIPYVEDIPFLDPLDTTNILFLVFLEKLKNCSVCRIPYIHSST